MEEKAMELGGKVVMVTGASSSIGREICLDLASCGCRIVAAARRADRLRSLCDEINDGAVAGGAPRSVAVELDVSADESAIEAAVRKAWDAFGRIDALVNNAGIRGGVHSPLDWTEGEWDVVFRTNLKGLWLVTKHVCRRMATINGTAAAGQKQQQQQQAEQEEGVMKNSSARKIKGSVINISSTAGLHRGKLPGGIAYTASKEAVNSITKVMALELGAHGIRVNCICPGLFKSEITGRLMEKAWVKNVAAKTVPLRTFGTSDPAITKLVRLLIRDTSGYLTGNVFIVDAGATLPGIPIFSSL